MTDSGMQKKARKKAKREARLWEDTIVIALRDAQWMRSREAQSSLPRQPDGQKSEASSGKEGEVNTLALLDHPQPSYPPRLIKFDGQAESRLGDVGMAMGERLFLIEVKSGRAQVRDEWGKKKGTFRPKKLYARLSTLVDHCNEKPGRLSQQDPMDRLLFSSLCGHFIAYWDVLRDQQTEQKQHAIILVPYLQAVINSRTDQDDDRPGMIVRMPISKVCAGTVRANQAYLATASDLGRQDCHVFYRNPEGKARCSKNPIGLNAQQFQDYVNFLCGGPDQSDGSESINAVMLSSQGSFFHILSSTSDLAALLSMQIVPKQQVATEPQEEEENVEESDRDGPSP